MSSKILCGPCGHVNTQKNVQTWCTNCEEGFCAECEQIHRSMKVTRDHVLISTDDCRKIKNVHVNLKCNTHGKKFDLYCKSHDVAICVACFPFLHKHCADVVISLDEAAQNAKRSTALYDLEYSIKVALENMKHLINNRHVAIKILKVKNKASGHQLVKCEQTLTNIWTNLKTKCYMSYPFSMKTANQNMEKLKSV
ncbi:Hypothetical predicted protein [Mytilus galloprovincialis]|uniref:B box-type domain-containing protein n=1 Tax=Mytilus galloprovincialis TaxID=29158 RepID=A0A8B6GYL4_MYTGA|nr:Hypothetical predicted protein [Mytilus galloprovincialis]